MSKQRSSSEEAFYPSCWKDLHPALLGLLRMLAAEVARRWLRQHPWAKAESTKAEDSSQK